MTPPPQRVRGRGTWRPLGGWSGAMPGRGTPARGLGPRTRRRGAGERDVRKRAVVGVMATESVQHEQRDADREHSLERREPGRFPMPPAVERIRPVRQQDHHDQRHDRDEDATDTIPTEGLRAAPSATRARPRRHRTRTVPLTAATATRARRGTAANPPGTRAGPGTTPPRRHWPRPRRVATSSGVDARSAGAGRIQRHSDQATVTTRRMATSHSGPVPNDCQRVPVRSTR